VATVAGITTGSNNLCIGTNSSTTAANTTYAVALGDSAVAASNEFALGPNLQFQSFHGLSSTNTNRTQGKIKNSFIVSTDASYTGRLTLSATDHAGDREVIRVDSTGTAGALGFFATAAVAQYATTGTTAGFTAGAGSTVDSAATFTGNTGATAYTIGDVIRALKQYGLLAA
jgi:hypothetical protein